MAAERLDILVHRRGLAESREQARRLIDAGQILVDGQLAGKAGHRVRESVVLQVKALPRFVSRGGEKLEEAFRVFSLDVAGRICLDVGASTGGFTDCLLQHGAARVLAVDVGHGQLHWKLRSDPRVTVLEKVNARYLEAAALPCRPELATVDVSFISLTMILPAVRDVLAPGACIVSLIKPQFEAGRDKVEKGGVVRDDGTRRDVVSRVRRFGVETLGLEWRGLCESPIKGPAGNVEFLACWATPGQAPAGLRVAAAEEK